MALSISLPVAHVLQTPAPTTPYCPIAAETGFSNTYLARRPGGRTHKGIDLFAQQRAPIVAPESGTLSFGRNRLGGTVARLQADGGNYYYFAHLADWATELVEPGPIEAGWVIAYVGTSGNARGGSPHLHIEVRINGSRINPFHWLVKSCNNKVENIPVPLFPVFPDPSPNIV